MKIEKLSESRFQVYLNKFYIKEKELETDEDLEEYFRSCRYAYSYQKSRFFISFPRRRWY